VEREERKREGGTAGPSGTARAPCGEARARPRELLRVHAVLPGPGPGLSTAPRDEGLVSSGRVGVQRAESD
jgi:hypothetical protein